MFGGEKVIGQGAYNIESRSNQRDAEEMVEK